MTMRRGQKTIADSEQTSDAPDLAGLRAKILSLREHRTLIPRRTVWYKWLIRAEEFVAGLQAPGTTSKRHLGDMLRSLKPPALTALATPGSPQSQIAAIWEKIESCLRGLVKTGLVSKKLLSTLDSINTDPVDPILVIQQYESQIQPKELRDAVIEVTKELHELRALVVKEAGEPLSASMVATKRRGATDDTERAKGLRSDTEVKTLKLDAMFEYFDAIPEVLWPQLKDQFQLWLDAQTGESFKSNELNAKFASGVTERAKRLGYRFRCQGQLSHIDNEGEVVSDDTLCNAPSGLRWMTHRGCEFGIFYFGHVADKPTNSINAADVAASASELKPPKEAISQDSVEPLSAIEIQIENRPFRTREAKHGYSIVIPALQLVRRLADRRFRHSN